MRKAIVIGLALAVLEPAAVGVLGYIVGFEWLTITWWLILLTLSVLTLLVVYAHSLWGRFDPSLLPYHQQQMAVRQREEQEKRAIRDLMLQSLGSGAISSDHYRATLKLGGPGYRLNRWQRCLLRLERMVRRRRAKRHWTNEEWQAGLDRLRGKPPE